MGFCGFARWMASKLLSARPTLADLRSAFRRYERHQEQADPEAGQDAKTASATIADSRMTVPMIQPTTACR